MKIDINTLRKYLESMEKLGYSDLGEYQNKYYLAKKIQEKFPALTEKIIYNAIEITNQTSKNTFLKKKYITNLCKNLLSLYNYNNS